MDCVDKIAQAREWIQHTDNIVFSAEPVHRQKAGYRIFAVKTAYTADPAKRAFRGICLEPLFMVENPDDFSYLYKNNLIYPDAVPSVLHRVLVEWEEQGKLKTIITQNVDRLHQGRLHPCDRTARKSVGSSVCPMRQAL